MKMVGIFLFIKSNIEIHTKLVVDSVVRVITDSLLTSRNKEHERVNLFD